MSQEIIQKTISALENNHFEVYSARNSEEACDIFFREIFDKLRPLSVSWGDSETMKGTGVLETLEQHPECVLIRTFQEGYSRTQKTYWRRQALLADLFLTGSNAVTQQGQLVNVDMIGNRVAGITFGPEHVVLFIGTNKIVGSLEEARERIRTHAAPQNAIRHTNLHTPCQKTGTCMDCRSADRLCNTWVITEKCFPFKRIKIILINDTLGL